MTRFLRRALGASLLDWATYEEVEADASANLQALTVVLIQHDENALQTCYGRLIAEGTPEEIASNRLSHTGRFLKQLFHAC